MGLPVIHEKEVLQCTVRLARKNFTARDADDLNRHTLWRPNTVIMDASRGARKTNDNRIFARDFEKTLPIAIDRRIPFKTPWLLA
jgi:hypothetical protein